MTKAIAKLGANIYKAGRSDVKYKKSCAARSGGMFYVTDGMRALRTAEPIEGAPYLPEGDPLGAWVKIFKPGDGYRFGEIGCGAKGIGAAIKEATGTPRGRAVWGNGGLRISLNARWLKQVMEALGCKKVLYLDNRNPLYFFKKDAREEGAEAAMLLPLVNAWIEGDLAEGDIACRDYCGGGEGWITKSKNFE